MICFYYVLFDATKMILNSLRVDHILESPWSDINIFMQTFSSIHYENKRRFQCCQYIFKVYLDKTCIFTKNKTIK